MRIITFALGCFLQVTAVLRAQQDDLNPATLVGFMGRLQNVAWSFC